jgi:hypothetical protein
LPIAVRTRSITKENNVGTFAHFTQELADRGASWCISGDDLATKGLSPTRSSTNDLSVDLTHGISGEV